MNEERTLKQLEADLAAAEHARDDVRERIEALALILAQLPATYTDVVNRRRVQRRRGFWIVAVIPIALTVYHLGIRPSSDFDQLQEQDLKNSIGILHGEVDRTSLRDDGLEEWVQDALDRKHLAELADEPSDSVVDGNSYPALRAAELDEAHGRVLRWGNVGIAACRVDEEPLARRALGALRWLTTPTVDGLPAPPWHHAVVEETDEQRAANTATAWVLTECTMNGINLLPALFGTE